MHFSTKLEISPYLPNNNAMKACEDLLNKFLHINNIINVHSFEQVCNNHLQLNTPIDTICWLAFQVWAFKDHEKTP